MWRTIKNMIRPCLRIWEWEWSEGYFLSGGPVVHVHNQLCLALQRDFYIMTLPLPPPPPHTTANSLARRRFMAATSSQKCTFASSSSLFTAAALRRAPLSSSRRTTVGRRGVRGVAWRGTSAINALRATASGLSDTIAKSAHTCSLEAGHSTEICTRQQGRYSYPRTIL